MNNEHAYVILYVRFIGIQAKFIRAQAIMSVAIVQKLITHRLNEKFHNEFMRLRYCYYIFSIFFFHDTFVFRQISSFFFLAPLSGFQCNRIK